MVLFTFYHDFIFAHNWTVKYIKTKMSQTSIVEYFSAHEKYKCGYCKNEDTCYSFGKNKS